MAPASSWIHQAAAIPVKDGQVCIVQSRSRKRWVIPKGCAEPGKSLGEIALQEAWEEAGLLGLLDPDSVGTYLYEKWGSTHHVTVFLMQVREVAAEWPEREVRQRCWLTPSKALARIQEEGLRDILRSVLSEHRISLHT
jgi:8-oxo-dGTP pyrophosphatase MutT (NUDIX family)